MNHLQKIFLIVTISIFIIMTFSHTFPGLAKDRMNGPPKPHTREYLQTYGSGDNDLLDFYQRWISPVKGENGCPMYPSCSQYAKISFQLLPWYKAYTGSLERLLRCGNELQLYPRIRIGGRTFWYDPVMTKDSDKDVKSDPAAH